MADLERRLRTGQSLDHTVVLTFDDGYADQYADALPLLRQYGARATFYIVTGMVGRRGHVTWSDLRTMLAGGMDIAAHGVRHDDLAHMTGPQQAFQIDDSVLTLEQRLRTRIASYAYPAGRFDGETLMLMQRANVPLAVTTDARYVIPPENRFEMTRVRVLGEWGLPQFSRAIEAALVHASIVRRLGRTPHRGRRLIAVYSDPSRYFSTDRRVVSCTCFARQVLLQSRWLRSAPWRWRRPKARPFPRVQKPTSRGCSS